MCCKSGNRLKIKEKVIKCWKVLESAANGWKVLQKWWNRHRSIILLCLEVVQGDPTGDPTNQNEWNMCIGQGAAYQHLDCSSDYLLGMVCYFPRTARTREVFG
jgi:hypothetical protein